MHFVATTPRSENVWFAPFFVGGVSFFSDPQNDSYLGLVMSGDQISARNCLFDAQARMAWQDGPRVEARTNAKAIR